MNKLVAGNLVHRPLRSLISVFAIAIEVIMILSIAAILMGKLNGFKTRQNGIGMDILVRPNTASNLIGMSPAGASIKVADVLAKIPHVVVAAPVNIQITTALDTIYCIDFEEASMGCCPSRSSLELPFRAPTMSSLTTTLPPAGRSAIPSISSTTTFASVASLSTAKAVASFSQSPPWARLPALRARPPCSTLEPKIRPDSRKKFAEPSSPRPA